MMPTHLRTPTVPFAVMLLATVATAACGASDAPDSAQPTGDAGTGETAAETSPADPTVRAPAPADPVGLLPPATFRGLTPCADCPGILTTVEVSADGSSSITRRYIEGEPDRDPAFVEEGRWRVDDSRRVELRPNDGDDPSLFVVYEGDLAVLNRDGSPPTTLSPILERVPAGAMAQLAGTSWRFVDPAPAGGAAATPSLRFMVDGSVGGSDGCNAFRSSWTVEGEALSIAPLAATRMACPEGGGIVALRVVEAIAAAAGYRLEEEGSLVLLGSAGESVARLRPTP